MRRPSKVLAALLAGGLAAGLLFALAPGSGAQSQAPPEAAATVVLQGQQFVPNRVDLAGPGLTVRWDHQDGNVPHTITFDPPSSPSDSHPNCNSDGSGECFKSDHVDYFVLFDSPGTFNYHCKVHAAMKGVVVVAGAVPVRTTTTAAGGATTTTRATTGTTVGTLGTTTTVEETTTTSSPTTTSTPPFSTSTTAPEIVQSAAADADDDDQASGLLLAVGVLLLAAVVAALIPAWRRLT